MDGISVLWFRESFPTRPTATRSEHRNFSAYSTGTLSLAKLPQYKRGKWTLPIWTSECHTRAAWHSSPPFPLREYRIVQVSSPNVTSPPPGFSVIPTARFPGIWTSKYKFTHQNIMLKKWQRHTFDSNNKNLRLCWCCLCAYIIC